MAGKTRYLEEKILDHVLRAIGFAAPATVYLGLFTVAPTDTTSGTEVTGGGYVRQAIAFSAPSSGVCTNSGIITYPEATATWGRLISFGIFDAVSSGNMLYWGTLSSFNTVTRDLTVSFPVGSISVTED